MYKIEIMTISGKIMFTQLADDLNSVIAVVKHNAKRVNGTSIFRHYDKDGFTYVDYGSHSVMLRYRLLK